MSDTVDTEQQDPTAEAPGVDLGGQVQELQEENASLRDMLQQRDDMVLFLQTKIAALQQSRNEFMDKVLDYDIRTGAVRLAE